MIWSLMSASFVDLLKACLVGLCLFIVVLVVGLSVRICGFGVEWCSAV